MSDGTDEDFGNDDHGHHGENESCRVDSVGIRQMEKSRVMSEMGGFERDLIRISGQAPTAIAAMIALLVIFPTARSRAKQRHSGRGWARSAGDIGMREGERGMIDGHSSE